MSAPLSQERPATLEAATESDTPYGGIAQAWATVASLWVALELHPIRDLDAPDRPPDRAQTATAVARDHPFADVGQRLVLAGETPWRVHDLVRGQPEPGRMTLTLDRLL